MKEERSTKEKEEESRRRKGSRRGETKNPRPERTRRGDRI
jgi:hypothetical protein